MGAAIILDGSGSMNITGSVKFVDNGGKIGGAYQVTLPAGDLVFVNNTAYRGGAIALDGDGSFIMQNNVTFIENTAEREGGAMALLGNQTICLPKTEKATLIRFENNSVQRGGAFYFAHPNIKTLAVCNIQKALSHTSNINFHR